LAPDSVELGDEDVSLLLLAFAVVLALLLFVVVVVEVVLFALVLLFVLPPQASIRGQTSARVKIAFADFIDSSKVSGKSGVKLLAPVEHQIY
jgi:hypothetical protein